MKRLFAIIVVGLLLVGVLSAGGPLKILPDFELINVGNLQTVHSLDLAPQGKWLLIYVRPQCASCDAMLRKANIQANPGLLEKTIVIVGAASQDDVRKMASKTPGWENASWYADPSDNVRKQMQLPGFPIVFGIESRNIRWAFSGSGVPDFHSMLNNWVKQ